MVLREGEVLGPYRVVALAGSGGMGEVWRARDDRLERDVALKVLHVGARDEASRRRLLAEARAVTALHHPNIVVVHDLLCADGHDVLVMEYVAGDVASQRIPAGGMKIRDALRIGIGVADALAAAHAAGIVHRDLKPANVLIGPSGTPKVLDFGLARRHVQARPSDLTIGDAPDSAAGLISGTPAYMSPEQAEGAAVDHRSDIFSFGLLLYELATGRRAFERGSVPETLTAVIKDDPDLPAHWPPSLARIVRRCLRKDPERRFQSMADVRLDLQDTLEEVERGVASQAPAPGRSGRLWNVVTVVVLAAAVLLPALWWLNRQSTGTPEWRVLPLTSLPGLEQQPALSPKSADQVAFTWDGGELANHDIYVQQVNGVTPPLRITTDPARDSSPCWSPDAGQIAFLRFKAETTDVILVSALGGGERTLARLPHEKLRPPPVMGLLPPTKIDWSPDGRFIALGTRTLSLLKVATGEVMAFSPAPGPGFDLDPAFSPDGRAIAYSRGGNMPHRRLWIQKLTADGSAAGAPQLLSQSFRSYSGLTWLDDTSVITSAGALGGSAGLFQVRPGDSLRSLAIEPLAAWYPDYAQEQGRLAYQRRVIDTDVMRIALGESVAMESRPFIASTYQDRDAMYSPDGTKVVFISTRSGQPAIWRANSDGTNQVLIGVVEQGVPGGPRWTPDGRSIVFDASSPETASDVFIVSAEGGTPRRLTSRPEAEVRPSVSRDGRWVYFVSAGQLWKISINGGEVVRLAAEAGMAHDSVDGRTMYFSRGGGVWRMPTAGGPAELFKANIREGTWSLTKEDLYEVRVRSGATAELVAHNLQTREERLLYTFPPRMEFFAANFIDVSPDGRFALVSPITRDESDLVVVDGLR